MGDVREYKRKVSETETETKGDEEVVRSTGLTVHTYVLAT